MDAGLDRQVVQVQVKGAGLWSAGVEFMCECLLLRTLAKGECCQAMLRQHEQLPAFITADVLRHYLAFMQQAEFITVGANGDGSAHELRWHRIAIAVESNASMRADDRRHDFVAVEGNGGPRPPPGTTPRE